MIIGRIWEMPSKWTFKMNCIQELFRKYQVGKGWIDPFSGLNSPAELTNDICSTEANYHLDALEFLALIENESQSGALFDPPYSVEQCLRKYTPKHNGTAGRAEYWAKCKDQLARIIKPGGYSMSFCWDSVGLGKSRGFELKEVLLICHGPCHNDTIVTIEKRVK